MIDRTSSSRFVLLALLLVVGCAAPLKPASTVPAAEQVHVVPTQHDVRWGSAQSSKQIIFFVHWTHPETAAALGKLRALMKHVPDRVSIVFKHVAPDPASKARAGALLEIANRYGRDAFLSLLPEALRSPELTASALHKLAAASYPARSGVRLSATAIADQLDTDRLLARSAQVELGPAFVLDGRRVPFVTSATQLQEWARATGNPSLKLPESSWQKAPAAGLWGEAGAPVTVALVTPVRCTMCLGLLETAKAAVEQAHGSARLVWYHLPGDAPASDARGEPDLGQQAMGLIVREEHDRLLELFQAAAKGRTVEFVDSSLGHDLLASHHLFARSLGLEREPALFVNGQQVAGNVSPAVLSARIDSEVKLVDALLQQGIAIEQVSNVLTAHHIESTGRFVLADGPQHSPNAHAEGTKEDEDKVRVRREARVKYLWAAFAFGARYLRAPIADPVDEEAAGDLGIEAIVFESIPKTAMHESMRARANFHAGLGSSLFNAGLDVEYLYGLRVLGFGDHDGFVARGGFGLKFDGAGLGSDPIDYGYVAASVPRIEAGYQVLSGLAAFEAGVSGGVGRYDLNIGGVGAGVWGIATGAYFILGIHPLMLHAEYLRPESFDALSARLCLALGNPQGGPAACLGAQSPSLVKLDAGHSFDDRLMVYEFNVSFKASSQ